MKLASLYLDDAVVIPSGKSMGEGLPRTALRDSSFHADEGWDIREVIPGVFSLLGEGMTEPVTVGGYGYTYTALRVEPVDTEAPPATVAPKGKKR